MQTPKLGVLHVLVPMRKQVAASPGKFDRQGMESVKEKVLVLEQKDLELLRQFGACTVLNAELWATHDGLSVAWDQGYKRIVVETDCLSASHLLNASYDNGTVQNLVQSKKRIVIAHFLAVGGVIIPDE